MLTNPLTWTGLPMVAPWDGECTSIRCGGVVAVTGTGCAVGESDETGVAGGACTTVAVGEAG